jgi:hypothetical protein
MAYASITKPSLHFNTKLYTGNASSRTISGIGFQPDFTWSKNRGNDDNHYVFDAVRGATKYIIPDNNTLEGTASGITAWNADGYTLGSSVGINANGVTAVSWNWKANGAGSANTDGSINTTSTSVNTTAGFSISKYTGTAATATIGHGLGVAPKMMITKRISGGNEDWGIYHASIGATKYLKLNATDAEGSSSGVWNNTAPTSSVFSVGSSSLANGSGTYVAYCFAEKKGYSKIGPYTGNGNADGPFIYTGFQPAWVIIKNAGAAEQWRVYDNKRDPVNHMFRCLFPNSNVVENTTDNGSEEIDFVSNGIKIRSSAAQLNGNGNTLIYMAFAAEPLVANVGASIPATAR